MTFAADVNLVAHSSMVLLQNVDIDNFAKKTDHFDKNHRAGLVAAHNAGGWNLQRSPNFFITLTRLFGIGPGGERGKLESVDKKATTEESVEKHESQDTDEVPVSKISDKIKEMLDLENSEKKAVAVILWGGESTGKQKLAKEVCSKIKDDQNWVQVTVESSEINGSIEPLIWPIDTVTDLRYLQLEILRKLQLTSECKNENENENEVEIESDAAWERNLWHSLHNNKSVFIYTDCVLSAEMIKKLLPKGLVLNKGIRVRVLLTVEDKHVISALDGSVFQKKVYSMQPLSYDQALPYFLKCLRKSSPEAEPVLGGKEDSVESLYQKLPSLALNCLGRERERVLSKIIKICNVYKYRMDVVSDHLSKNYNDEDDYNSFFNWLKTEERSFKELNDYISCEVKFLKLSELIRDALLDICSFFNKSEWNQAACIVGNEALKKLEELELLKKESGNVSVSNTVMSFGLSRAQGNRVTNVADLHTSLSRNNPPKMKGIWLLQNKLPFHIPARELDKMDSSLRVLALGDSTIVEGECKNQFKELRYFQAGRVANHPFNITNLNQPRFLENISDKDMLHSQKVPLTLRIVKLKLNHENVEDCINLHKVLPKACKIVELDISGRESTSAEKDESKSESDSTVRDQRESTAKDIMESKVKGLPKGFCELYALESLVLTKCIGIKSLPTCFGKLRSLKFLDLSYCKTLTELPTNFGWLTSLQNFNLSFCRELEDLPDSMGLLTSVVNIDLSYCKKLQKLPKSFVKLSTLRVLNLKACSHLSELPEGFEGLDLEELCLQSCKRLKTLPQKIGKSTLLQKTVSISWCLSLPELSISFIHLIEAHVEHLFLVNCTGLKELPLDFPKQLSRLKTLNLSGCRSLLQLPKRFQKLKCIEKLNLSSCEKLEEIRLRGLPLLKEVNLSNCERLKGSCLKSLMKVKSLRFIDIHDSPNLVERWNQMERENTVCNFTVATGRPSLRSPSFHSLRVSRDSGIAMVNKGTSPFFNDKWFFVNLNGHPFYPSTLEEGTTVAVIFYRNYDNEELHRLLNILDDLQITCNKLQILHVGRSVSSLPTELAIRHLVCSSDDYEAQVFFENELCGFESFDQMLSYVMITSEVVISKEGKAFSSWTSITRDSLSVMAVDVPASESLRLKELIETPQASNTELLEALLITKKTNFLLTSTTQEAIIKLEGKFIFLLVSWLDKFEKEESTFNDVYAKLKRTVDEKPWIMFEVVWIPIVSHGRGTPVYHAEMVKKIAWPSIGDPWSITPLANQFLRMHFSIDKLPLFIGVSPTGQLHSENFVPETGIKAMENFMQ